MGLLGDVFGAVSGLISSKKTNKLNKAQLAEQKRLTDQQIKISDYINSLSQDLMAKGSTQVDPYGGTTGYDPVTGTYKSTMGAVPGQIQGASDAEEFARYVSDQALRRQGLAESDKIRHTAYLDSDAAMQEMQDFRRGIGKLDPTALASRMRLNREQQVNAGYDDAERAAQTLQLRTGSSAVGDALGRLARDRVRAQLEIGDPETEALQLAEQVNSNRFNTIASRYTSMADRGSNFYDAAFGPAQYAGIADAKTADAMKFDLSKYDVAQGGSGIAAQGIGQAASGLRSANQAFMQNRIANPWGNFVSQMDQALEKPVQKYFSGGFGG
jgi:hypothetical protein